MVQSVPPGQDAFSGVPIFAVVSLYRWVDAGPVERGQINQQPRSRATDLGKRDLAALSPPADGAGGDAGGACRIGDTNPIVRPGHAAVSPRFSKSTRHLPRAATEETFRPETRTSRFCDPEDLCYIRRPLLAASYCSNESHRAAPRRARRTLNARMRSPHRLQSPLRLFAPR